MDLTDLMERIDASFGDGPDHRPVADRLSEGRRAVRRRRGAAGLTALATAAIVGSVGWSLVGAQDAPSSGSFLATPGAALPIAPAGVTPPGCLIDVRNPVPSQQTAPAVPGDPHLAWTYTVHCGESDMPPVVFLAGVLHRATADVQVDQLVQPAGPDGGISAAAVVDVAGRTEWVFTQANTGNITTVSAPSPDGQTFEEWASAGPEIQVTGLPDGDSSNPSGPTAGVTGGSPGPGH